MSFGIFSTPQQQQQQTPQSPFQTQPFGQSGSLFGQQQQQTPQAQPFGQSGSLFGQQQQQTPQAQPFGQSGSPFGQSGSLFGQSQQQQQFPQQQPQQQILYLYTNEKVPASYSTKWADLHPDSQKFLQKIEERILEYRDESQRLDQSSRLCDSSVTNEGFEIDAGHVIQELGGISSVLERQKAQIHALMSNAKEMLRNTEMAIRAFMMLRPRFVHPKVGGSSNVGAPSQTPGATIASSTGQSTASDIMPVLDFYSGLPKKPSPFLQQRVARYEMYLNECRQWIEEIEQLLANSDRNASNGSLLQSLPQVMANVHDFFVHTAAKVESIHQYIESVKATYLAEQRRRGDGSNPFLEADRRETAKLEAAAKRVHPSLYLPANSHTSAQVSGLPAGSATPAASTAVPASTVTTAAGSGLSLLSTPSAPASSMSSSLFATPTTSAPASSLFPSSVATPQTSLFPSSSGSLFGTAASTPSSFTTPFGSAASTPSSFTTPFGSAASTGGSLFSTPLPSGAATGSGASFGTTSRSQRPKSRQTRR